MKFSKIFVALLLIIASSTLTAQIDLIQNGEQFSSVRAKLNQVITSVNAGTGLANLEDDGTNVQNSAAGIGYFQWDNLRMNEFTFSNIVNNQNLIIDALGTGNVSIEGADLIDGSIFLAEKANGNADVVSRGQIWVRNDVPNTLIFTDDTGVDHDLTAAGATSAGPVNRIQAADGSGGFISNNLRLLGTETIDNAVGNTVAFGDQIDLNNTNIIDASSVFVQEKASADADVLQRGQIWVRNDSPNVLVFTDDTGQDIVLSPISGSFTPVTSSLTNVSVASPISAFYSVSGNIVTITYNVLVNVSAVGGGGFDITLPSSATSDFTSSNDAILTGTSGGTQATRVRGVAQSATDNIRVGFNVESASGSTNLFLSGQYIIK